MDIKKEREAFVEKYRKVYKVDKSLFVNDSGEFTDLFCQDAWVMWQAAKAQAVPEGFVLVEKTKLMQIVGSAAIIEPITRGNPLMSKYKTELDFILSTVRAMIEAQEPTND